MSSDGLGWGLRFSIFCMCYFWGLGKIHRFALHYAPEIFKMWSLGLTLLKFDTFTATYKYSTWNQLLANPKGQKLSFLAVSEVLNFDFSKFEQFSSSKFTEFKTSESLHLPKITFLSVWICKNLISHKMWVAAKWLNINKVKP